MKKATGWRKVVINATLSILALLWVFPLVFMLYNSFKGQAEYNLGYFWDFPQGNELVNNLEYIQSSAGVFDGMLSSLIYSLCGTVFAVAFALLAAYALVYLKIRRRMFWFLFIYSGTIFPFQVYLIPIYKGYSTLGFYNTRFGMILFYSAICIPFAMFVFRNFFLGISSEVCEAARVDGASNFGVLRRIILPMSAAPLSVVFITQFSWCWNDLLFGLTFTKSPDTRPIMASLSLMGTKHVPALLLACLVASIPTMVLFFFLHKKMELGLVYTDK